jgi:mannose-6-phosphate isomerase-like protein (cupin superfamily)
MSMQAADYLLTGLSIADTSNPITTYHQIGGGRTVFNTVLAVPSHLNASSPTPGDAPWNSLEHVVIPPFTAHRGEAASVGEHVQATDEIYFIHQGRGRLTTNGVSSLVSAGTLVVAPRGTRHSIENAFPGELLAFLVIELHAPAGSASHQPTVIESLPVAEAGDLRALLGGQPAPLRVCRIDLAGYFSAPWGDLSLLELPPGARIEEYTLHEQDENLFIAEGFATVSVAGVRIDPPDNGGHRNVVVPWGIPRRLVNASMRDPLKVLSVRIHRQVAGLSRSRSGEAAGTAASPL